jgi:hypothetical protein
MSAYVTASLTICSALLAVIPALSGLVSVSIGVRLTTVGILLAVGMASLAQLLKPAPTAQANDLRRRFPLTIADRRRSIVASLPKCGLFATAVALAVYLLASTVGYHNVRLTELRPGGFLLRAPHFAVKSVIIRPSMSASHDCIVGNANPQWRANISTSNWSGPTAQASLTDFISPERVEVFCARRISRSEFAVTVEPTTASAIDESTIRGYWLWFGVLGLIVFAGGAIYIAQGYIDAS